MASPSFNRMGRCWSGALLAFLAMGILSPQRAQAGCSSYGKADPAHAGGAVRGLELLDEVVSGPSHQDEASPKQPRPCSGVFCSGNTAPPFSPPPPDPHTSARHWAIAAFLWRPPMPDPSLSADTDEGLITVDRPISIFRPPRTLSPSLV